MTRSELVRLVHARMRQKHINLTSEDAEIGVRLLLECMHQALVGGRRVEIRHFGAFWVAVRKARQARNPKTGTGVMVPPRAVPRFRAGKKLSESVNHEQNSVSV